MIHNDQIDKLWIHSFYYSEETIMRSIRHKLFIFESEIKMHAVYWAKWRV